MIEIKDLLNSFKEVLLGEEIRKEKIAFIIESVTKIKIETKNIEVKNSKVILDIKPIFKNEVFLKKEKILEEFRNNFPKRVLTDIL